MGAAGLAAVERVKGPGFARRRQAEFRRMSAPSPLAVTPERCAVQPAQFRELLDQPSAVDKGGAVARCVEAEAAVSSDPVAGGCL